MVDWRLGDRPDVSPDNGDDEMYNEMELVDHRDLGGFLCLVMPFVFKLKNESVAFVIPISFSATEVETTSVEEVNNSEESDDEEKFRMVVKGMSSAIWVESFILQCQKEAKDLKNSGHSQIPVDNGKTCPTYCGIWSQRSIKKKSTWHKSCRESLER